MIVDNVLNPKKVFGITDGYGGMKKVNFKKLQKIKKAISKF